MSETPSVLDPGRTLGPYEVVERLSGGATEIARARDTRSERHVALEVLPEHLRSADAREHLEADRAALAAAKHPCIVEWYEVGEADGVAYLAREMVAGETLAARLKKGAFSASRAARVGGDVARALAGAHARGVLHGALRPSSVRITHDDLVKVGGFGLVPAADAAPDAYTAPERTRGETADARSDIFALGSILYEMLSGHAAFAGDTPQALREALTSADPDEVDGVSPALDHLVRRCIEKDPRLRFQSAIDVAYALEALGIGTGAVDPTEAARVEEIAPMRRWLWLAAGAGVAGLGAGGAMWALDLRPPIDPRPPATFALIGAGTPLLDAHAVDVSADGRMVAFVARKDGVDTLYVRALDGDGPLEVGPADGGPFVSPDGAWVGFAHDGAVYRVPARHGRPERVADLPDTTLGGARGWDWTIGGILSVPSPASGLVRISEDGAVRTLVEYTGNVHYRWPDMLPGGTHTLVTAKSDDIVSFDDARIVALDLGTGEATPVLTGGMFARWSPTGHVVYARTDGLYAAPFDWRTRTPTGPSVKVGPRVWTNPFSGEAAFAVSDEGTLAYVPGPEVVGGGDIARVTRDGEATPLGLEPHAYDDAVWSPDRTRFAASASAATDFVVVVDVRHGTSQRLTRGQGDAYDVAWLDDETLAIVSDLGGHQIMRVSADGSGEPEVLVTGTGRIAFDQVIMLDGTPAVVAEHGPAGARDIVAFPLAEKPGLALVKTDADEFEPAVSPDGRWLAFASDASGRPEVYVRPYPSGEGQWKVSTEGGQKPLWSLDGKELLFRALEGDGTPSRVWNRAVSVGGGKSFTAGRPVEAYAPVGEATLVSTWIGALGGEPLDVIVVQGFGDVLRTEVPSR